MGVNIETHDWETGATTRQSGQSGFYTRSKPKATAHHGISNQYAMKFGKNIVEVLKCFMDDMTKSSTQGGRLVMHHLELQAGIIRKELQNASM